MQFGCPACHTTVSANFAKPGRFTPKCPKCGTPFIVQIQVTLAEEPALAAKGGEPKHSGPVKISAPRKPAPVDVDSTLPSAVDPATVDTPLDGKFVAETDPDATFASRTDEPAPKDFDRTAAAPSSDPDRTFASQPRKDAKAEDDPTEVDRTADYSPGPTP